MIRSLSLDDGITQIREKRVAKEIQFFELTTSDDDNKGRWQYLDPPAKRKTPVKDLRDPMQFWMTELLLMMSASVDQEYLVFPGGAGEGQNLVSKFLMGGSCGF